MCRDRFLDLGVKKWKAQKVFEFLCTLNGGLIKIMFFAYNQINILCLI